MHKYKYSLKDIDREREWYRQTDRKRDSERQRQKGQRKKWQGQRQKYKSETEGHRSEADQDRKWQRKQKTQ